MKLLLCTNCYDVIKLSSRVRQCKCKRCGGKYLNRLDAVYWGSESVPLGFNNSSLAQSIRARPQCGLGYRFDAFVIPIKCDTYTYLGPTKPTKKHKEV